MNVIYNSIDVLHLVTQSTSTIIDFEDQLEPQCKQLISNVHKAFKETLDV